MKISIFQTSVILLASTLILWSVAAGVSSYVSSSYERQHMARTSTSSANSLSGSTMTDADIARDDELAVLQAEVKKHPGDKAAHLAYAHALHSKARGRGDAQMLMAAVASYHQVLTLDQNDTEALRGLSILCLETGILDKAIEYLPRYIELKPDDIQAKTDYALALVSLGMGSEGEEVLGDVLKSDPKFVPAMMTLAYAKRKAGKEEEAQGIAEEALGVAEDEGVKERIKTFLLANSLSDSDGVEAVSESRDLLLSPAQVLTEYFKTHPIISSKLDSFRWESPTELSVLVDDFPASSMPEMAKQSFIGKSKAALAELPEELRVRLVDSKSKESLLEFVVGGVSPQEGTSIDDIKQ